MTRRYRHYRLTLVLATFLALLAPLAATQEAQPAPGEPGLGRRGLPTPEPVKKIFEMAFVDANDIAGVLGIFGCQIVVVGTDGRVIAVSGSEASVAAVEEAVKRLDVPPPPPEPAKNVELMADMLIASGEEGADERIPPRLNDVVAELRETFSYKRFVLLETAFIRCRDGEGGEASGVFPTTIEAPGNQPSVYRFRTDTVTVQADADPALFRLDELKLTVSLPYVVTREREGKVGQAVSWHEVGFVTDVDVREGQQAVVGKSSATDNPNATLFVVLTARLAE